MRFIMSTPDDMAGKGKPRLYNKEAEIKPCHLCNFSHPCLGGVGMAMRKMGSMAKPDVYIIKEGDTITVKTESTFKTSQFSFKIGEKFEENTLDGRKTQTLVSLKDDGSLIQEQEWDGKKTVITRKLVDGQLVVECDMNGVKCVRVYQKA
uniref:Fatty acid binding protein 5 n=1 Tax=Gallus gallus TaxID=9031 RepID=A0A8V0X7J3_CHICK